MLSPHFAFMANGARNRDGLRMRRVRMCRCWRRLAAPRRRYPCASNSGWRRWRCDLPVNRGPAWRAAMFSSVRCTLLTEAAVNTLLCLLGNKDLLGGNSVRAVAHPAPQRQLKRSQAAQLAFGSLDRSLDELLGNWAPIRKHDDPIHPCCPEAPSS